MAAGEWSEKRKMILTVVIGAVVNLIIGYFLYRANNQYKDLSKQLDGLKKANKDLQLVVDEKPVKQTELDGLKLAVQQKEKMLPEEAQLAKLIDEISAVGDENKCKRVSVTIVAVPGDAGLGGNYAVEKWRTRWEADFWGFAQMVNKMEERFPRFVSFENLNLAPKNSGMVVSGTPHDVNVDIVTYRYVRK